MVASDRFLRQTIATWQVKPTSLINTWLIHNQDVHQAAHKAAQTGPRTLRKVVETAVRNDEPLPGPEAALLAWALNYVDYRRLAKVLDKHQQRYSNALLLAARES
jgi:hypothetical protein